MSTQTKPSVVFAHGIWADGSCFSKVILDQAVTKSHRGSAYASPGQRRGEAREG
jgi:hypothetical protein